MRPPNFNQTLRLIWIDAKASAGTIQRKDLVETFHLSKSQASKDLAMYSQLFPGWLTYDRSAQCFSVVRPAFTSADHASIRLAVVAVEAAQRIWNK